MKVSNMAFWKLCNNGKLAKNQNGEFVDRYNYDELLRENRFLKKELTLDNFQLKVAHLMESADLDPNQRLAGNIYFTTLFSILREMKPSIAKDKQEPQHTELKENSTK